MNVPHEQMPRALLLDRTLSLGARATYPVIRYLAWKNGRRRDQDAVALPALEEIALLVGCSKTAVKSYIGELRRERWIATRRGSRRQPLLYLVYDDPSRADSDPLGSASRAESGPLSRADSDLSPYTHVEIDGEEANAPSRKRDVLWDALVEGIGPVATKTERGKRNRGLGELREIGATPEQILERCAEFRRRWPTMTLSPQSLVGNWTTLGEPTLAGRPPGGAMALRNVEDFSVYNR